MTDQTRPTTFKPTRHRTLVMFGLGAAFARDVPTGQIILGFSQEPKVFNPHLLRIEVDEGCTRDFRPPDDRRRRGKVPARPRRRSADGRERRHLGGWPDPEGQATELTWTMSAPHAPYLSILASTFIVPRHAFDVQADLNATPFNNAPICTGPFKWENRVAGDHIEMAANTEHFGDGPYVEKLIY